MEVYKTILVIETAEKLDSMEGISMKKTLLLLIAIMLYPVVQTAFAYPIYFQGTMTEIVPISRTPQLTVTSNYVLNSGSSMPIGQVTVSPETWFYLGQTWMISVTETSTPSVGGGSNPYMTIILSFKRMNEKGTVTVNIPGGTFRIYGTDMPTVPELPPCSQLWLVSALGIVFRRKELAKTWLGDKFSGVFCR